MRSENVRSASRVLRRLTRAALAAALSSALLAPGSAAAQTDEEKAAARALALQGADALKASKYAEALDLVSRAEAIFHAPPHLLMIARAQVGLGKLVAARETYLKLTREELAATAPAAFKNAQTTAKDEMAALDPKIAQLRIVLEGPGQKKATVKMDDVAVPAALIGVHRPVDPGRHAVAVFPTGLPPIKATVDLNEGEKKDLRLTVPDGPPPSGVPASAADNPDAPARKAPEPAKAAGFMTPLRGAGIGVGAVGVAGVVLGAVFAAKGGSTQSQADTLAAKWCTPKCPGPASPGYDKTKEIQNLDANAAKQKTIGAIGLGVGGAALVGGVVMVLVGKPRPPAAPAKAHVEPWLSPEGVGLRGEF